MVTFCNYLVNVSKMTQRNAMASGNSLDILVLSLKSSTGSHFLVIFFLVIVHGTGILLRSCQLFNMPRNSRLLSNTKVCSQVIPQSIQYLEISTKLRDRFLFFSL